MLAHGDGAVALSTRIRTDAVGGLAQFVQIGMPDDAEVPRIGQAVVDVPAFAPAVAGRVGRSHRRESQGPAGHGCDQSALGEGGF